MTYFVWLFSGPRNRQPGFTLYSVSFAANSILLNNIVVPPVYRVSFFDTFPQITASFTYHTIRQTLLGNPNGAAPTWKLGNPPLPGGWSASWFASAYTMVCCQAFLTVQVSLVMCLGCIL